MQQVVFMTIGEAPRRDIADSFDYYFAAYPAVVQAGVLNGRSVQEASRHFRPNPEEEVVVSTFCDGQRIEMSKEKIESALQKLITAYEERGFELIVVLCTAEFSNLKTKQAHLIEPEKILLPYIKSMFEQQKIGVVVPLPNQIAASKEKWQENHLKPVFAAASPYDYSEGEFLLAAQHFVEAGVNVIVLDCMGYSKKMKKFLQRHTGIPVYQSNELLFEYVITYLQGGEGC